MSVSSANRCSSLSLYRPLLSATALFVIISTALAPQALAELLTGDKARESDFCAAEAADVARPVPLVPGILFGSIDLTNASKLPLGIGPRTTIQVTLSARPSEGRTLTCVEATLTSPDPSLPGRLFVAKVNSPRSFWTIRSLKWIPVDNKGATIPLKQTKDFKYIVFKPRFTRYIQRQFHEKLVYLGSLSIKIDDKGHAQVVHTLLDDQIKIAPNYETGRFARTSDEGQASPRYIPAFESLPSSLRISAPPAAPSRLPDGFVDTRKFFGKSLLIDVTLATLARAILDTNDTRNKYAAAWSKYLVGLQSPKGSEQAKTAYQEALQLYPALTEANERLISLYKERKNPQLMREVMQAWAAAAPAWDDTPFGHLVRHFLKYRNVRDALNVIEKRPSGHVYLSAAREARSQEDYAWAEELYTRAIDKHTSTFSTKEDLEQELESLRGSVAIREHWLKYLKEIQQTQDLANWQPNPFDKFASRQKPPLRPGPPQKQ